MAVQIADPPFHFLPSLALNTAEELDGEVAGLLRVYAGELAEPLSWQRPGHRAEVAMILGQLAPTRSLPELLESWRREARLTSALRVAYAIAWVRLFMRRPGEAEAPAERGSSTALRPRRARLELVRAPG